MHRSIENGLSQSTVYDILQGPRGYLWVATRDGLNRYDGHHFRVYRPDPTREGTLTHRTVRALAADDHGLWVGTDGGGLHRYDPRTGRFTSISMQPGRRVHHPPEVSSQNQQAASIRSQPEASHRRLRCGDHILDLARSDDGTLWIGTRERGLCRLRPADKPGEGFKVERLHIDGQPVLMSARVWAILPEEDGTAWAGTDDGLIRVSATTTDTLLAGTSVRDVVRGPTGDLWAATDGRGLYRLVPSTGQRTRYHTKAPASRRLESDRVWTVFAASDGTVWAGTPDAGLHRVRTDGIDVFRHDPNRNESLSDDGIRTIQQDDAGTLWIGTNNGGMSGYAEGRSLFQHLVHDPDTPNSLPGNVVLSIAPETSQSVWIGMDGEGLAEWNRTTGVIRPLRHEVLSDAVVVSLLVSRDRHLWIGTDGNGLWRYHLDTEALDQFRSEDGQPEGLSDNSVLTLLEEPSGVLWIGTYRGLNRYDPETGRWMSYRETSPFSPVSSDSQRAPSGLRDERILSLHLDDTGTLWIGTYAGGVHRLETQGDDQKDPRPGAIYPVLQAGPSGLSSNRVQAIQEDAQGHFWLGTYNGLNVWNPEEDTVTVFQTQDGLPSNVVYGLLRDRENDLWMSTNRGLACIQHERQPLGTSTLEVESYTLDEGVQSLEFNGGSYAQAPDGTLLFGGINGLNAFHPDSLRSRNTHTPPITLTSATVMGYPQRVDSLLLADRPLRMDHDETYFELSFAVLDFVHPTAHQYAYRLRGLDAEWTESSNRRYARYTNVPPGSYVFDVRTRHRSGEWRLGPSLAIVVDPAFWETWWFRLFVLLGIAGLIVAGLLYRQHQRRHIEETRQRIADDLHDDLGGKVSSIALMLDAAQALPTETRAGVMSEAAQTAREAVADLRDIVWIVDAQYDDLKGFVTQIRTVVPLFFAEIESRVLAPSPMPDIALPVQARRHLYLLVKEALHNTARHAHATRVQVTIQVDNTNLTCSVTDNGDGFALDDVLDKRSGRGLKTMHRRAQAIGAILSIETEPDVGTTVSVTVPL